MVSFLPRHGDVRKGNCVYIHSVRSREQVTSGDYVACKLGGCVV
jgi:hypothetical protein